jgi:O-antigen ligase
LSETDGVQDLAAASAPGRLDRNAWRDPERLVGGTLIVLPLLALAVPRSLTVLIAVAGLLALTLPAVRRRALRLAATPAGMAAIGLYVWYVVSSAWAPPSDAGLWGGHTPVRPGLLVLLGIALVAAVQEVAADRHRRLLGWVAWCGIVMLALFGLGMAGCFWIPQRFLPALWEGQRSCDPEALWHAAPVVAILAAPLGVAIWRRFGWRLLLPLAVVAAVGLGLHFRAIARGAAIVGLLSFVLVLVGGRRIGIAIAALVALWVLAAPFVMGELIGNAALAERIHRLPLSWQERTIIWGTTIGQIEETPILGRGAGFSRYFRTVKRPPITLYTAAGPVYPPSEFRDPHSVVLHVWVETGAVGAVIFAGGLFALGLAAARRPASRAAVAASIGALAAWFAFATVAWSMADSLSVATAWSCLVVAAALLRAEPALPG